MSNRSSESRFLLQLKWIEQGCSKIKHFVCTTFLTETKELLRTGWVLSVFMLLEYSLLTTSVVFCGRLGQREMAAAALTQSIISILCFMPGYGMVTVCNTYFAAGFGSTDGQKQETILQKSLILSGLVSLLCWALLINTESILRLLQQEESIVLMVGVLVRAYLPAVPAVFASFVLSRFLQCRNHEMITMVAMVVAAVVNILLNYLFVIVMKGGASWSFGAVVIAQYIDLFILSAYVYKYEDFKGWTTESLDDWYEFSVIGINGCLMIELGIIIFEAGYLFCGTIDDLAMDVFGAVYIILFYTFMGYMPLLCLVYFLDSETILDTCSQMIGQLLTVLLILLL
ncbi:multidrug and toxin extrusion protein 1-like isoform X2 [Anneissia japonica]|uniref:multidrug and toxin extrusion protein 1-like isoform X2 n=1 Tax=Anneissia japonica TaxID=1529436 RepID=UPI0014255CBD|nr:multidrug and toxin extrusion protein 1-like isoform X2 [Anneissia japonica]